MGKRDRVMGVDILLAKILVGIALAIVLAGFAVLGDLTQRVFAFPHSVIAAMWWARFLLMTLALAAITGGLYLGLMSGTFAPAPAAGLGALFVLLFVSGFVLVPYIMFKGDGTRARFVAHGEAGPYLDDGDEVAVLELGGEARGYPLDWITRPHLAANTRDPMGPEGVVMTFCSLSRSAIAFEPRIEGARLDLGVLGQAHNNLVLYDRVSNRPIQQLRGQFGVFRGAGEAMARHATTVMPYGAYRALYPAGRVYFNPPGAPFRGPLARLLDRGFRALLTVILERHYDPATAGPWFPTIGRFDNRLKPKTFVYGFDIGGDRVAYTEDFVAANGDRIDTKIGGRAVAIVRFPDHGFIDAFLTGGQQDVDIGPRGEIGLESGAEEGARLARQPMVPRIFWMVWYFHFPDTDVNRI